MFFFGFNFFQGFPGLLLFPLAAWASVWTYRHAASRGLSPLIWAGISFSIFPLGFIIYLIYAAVKGRTKV